jgi:hypothetical protein
MHLRVYVVGLDLSNRYVGDGKWRKRVHIAMGERNFLYLRELRPFSVRISDGWYCGGN